MDCTAENGDETRTTNEAELTALGANRDNDETALAARQRYSGQSGVEHVFVLRAFSLLQASQHALTGEFITGFAPSEERPVNMKSTTARRTRLTTLSPTVCIEHIIQQEREKAR